METNHLENEILEKWKQGGEHLETAFRKLVSFYGPKLYVQIKKNVGTSGVDDVLQEVFLKVYQNLSKFRGEAKLSSWLYRIAHNESMNYLKKNHRNAQKLSDVIVEVIAEGDFYSPEEISSLLKQAISKLPEKQSFVFCLRYFEEKSFSEISQITGTSVGALKSSYHLARKKIEEFLRSQLNY